MEKTIKIKNQHLMKLLQDSQLTITQNNKELQVLRKEIAQRAKDSTEVVNPLLLNKLKSLESALFSKNKVIKKYEEDINHYKKHKLELERQLKMLKSTLKEFQSLKDFLDCPTCSMTHPIIDRSVFVLNNIEKDLDFSFQESQKFKENEAVGLISSSNFKKKNIDNNNSFSQIKTASVSEPHELSCDRITEDKKKDIADIGVNDSEEVIKMLEEELILRYSDLREKEKQLIKKDEEIMRLKQNKLNKCPKFK
ncbi:hypothetical protein HK099_002756 [Clydaea vesicula]|uniref:Uncharacterized protein n=1 Tax=Clydaea vesicula TaxID=447962 RepID=A0AAD5U2L9_9FUNG|nr:hypothetical protein HK099_002756 [Clydaea vesicula]KAJ3397835.1 hypothetical protein HDU92_002507 [Lobulomyces angularis]